MDKTFIIDLDAVLDFLYAHQVALEYETPERVQEMEDAGKGPTQDIHYYCVDEATLFAVVIANDARDINAPLVFRFISEQLSKDELIRKDYGQGVHKQTHYHITAKGKLFKEGGGYAQSHNDRIKSTRAKKTAAIARIAETTMLIFIAIFTLYLQFTDSASETRVVELEKHVVKLESERDDFEARVLQLEHELLIERTQPQQSRPLILGLDSVSAR